MNSIVYLEVRLPPSATTEEGKEEDTTTHPE